MPGKGTDPSSAGQQTRQILCCAFNANGTVFVTGSSDTYARVNLVARVHYLKIGFKNYVAKEF